MYNSNATIRGDINTVVTEAAMGGRYGIGLAVMPPLSVPTRSGSYAKIKIAEGGLLEAVSTVRDATGSYGTISRQWGSDTYDTIDNGLEEMVDDAEAKDVGRFFNLEATAATLTLQNMMLAHEVRVAAATFNTSNYGSATNSTVAYTAANLATISFVGDVLAAIERLADKGVVANTIVTNSTVMARLKQATLVQNWVRGSIVGNLQTPLNAANLAASFADNGIEQVLVGRSRYNTAKKGQTYSATPVWSNTYVWVGYVNPRATDVRQGGSGFTFHWNEEGGLFVTETYRSDERRSNIVRVRQHTAEKVTDGTAGTLIATQYS